MTLEAPVTSAAPATPTWRDRALQVLGERFGPFAALLDSRYIPLLLLAAPQAYTVYQWLWLDSDQSLTAGIFAGVGAAAFEAAYVGSVAWAEQGTNDKQKWWLIGTAALALVFSVLVAVRVHWDAQGWWALLHAGFPLVACLYTVTVHSATVTRRDIAPAALVQWREGIESALASLTTKLEELATTAATTAIAAAQTGDELRTNIATLVGSIESLTTTANDRDMMGAQTGTELQQQMGSLAQHLVTLTHKVETLATTNAHRDTVGAQTGTELQQQMGSLAQSLATLSKTVASEQRTGRDTADAIASLTESMNELRATINAPSHPCPDCGAPFSSASALGGHRSRCPARNKATLNGHGGQS